MIREKVLRFALFRGTSERKKVLILLLSDFFVLCKRPRQLTDRGRQTFLCAHFTKNGHNYSMFQIKISQRRATNFSRFLNWNERSEKKWKLKDRKIIGTIFKVNQNQITSKFHDLNHSSRAVRGCFLGLRIFNVFFFAFEHENKN